MQSFCRHIRHQHNVIDLVCGKHAATASNYRKSTFSLVWLKMSLPLSTRHAQALQLADHKHVLWHTTQQHMGVPLQVTRCCILRMSHSKADASGTCYGPTAAALMDFCDGIFIEYNNGKIRNMPK